MNSPLRIRTPRLNAPRAHSAAPHPFTWRQPAHVLLPLLASAALLLPTLSSGQPDPKNPHVEATPAPGPAQDLTPHPGMVIAGQVAIGQPAPAFELDSSLGYPVQLTSLRGGWTALFFMPRMSDASDFEPTARALQAANVRLVGLCHERARSVESYAQHNRLSWMLLADVTGEVGAMYGLWDTAQRGFLPGLVLLDTHGIVRYASIGLAFSPDQLRDIVLEAREKT